MKVTRRDAFNVAWGSLVGTVITRRYLSIPEEVRPSPPLPAQRLWVALLTKHPETGELVEPFDPRYSRQEIELISSGASLSNPSVVEFPIATASWGTVVAVALHDERGEILRASLDSAKTVSSGDQFRFPANGVEVAPWTK